MYALIRDEDHKGHKGEPAFIAMIKNPLHFHIRSIHTFRLLNTIESGIECRETHSLPSIMTSTVTMMETSSHIGGRSTTSSHLLDHWSPTRDHFPSLGHYSSCGEYPPNKRQRRDNDWDYPTQQKAPTHVLQNRTIAKLKSTAASAISRGSTGSYQSRTYNPNNPDDKKSRSRTNFEILEIRDYPLPRMKDISATICCRFPKEEFEVGTIIKAPIHEEDFNWTARPPSVEASESFDERGRYSHSGMSAPRTTDKKGRHITFSNWNDPIYTEVRFMIVVALFYDHYLAIPLYTHGGNGLANKNNKWEYASIEDYREPRSLQEAGFLLHTEYLKPDCKHLLPKSVAHIAYPVSRKYNLPVAPQGRLREDSKGNLVQIFGQYMLGNKSAIVQLTER